MSDQVTKSASKEIQSAFVQFREQAKEWIPSSATMWIILLACVIVIVALSRVVSLQKSVTELQNRPVVDEHLVRQVVRGHLEETVRAMEQQNKMHMQLRQQQAMEQAKQAALAAQAAAAQASTAQPVQVAASVAAVAQEVPTQQPEQKVAEQKIEEPVASVEEPNAAPVAPANTAKGPAAEPAKGPAAEPAKEPVAEAVDAPSTLPAAAQTEVAEVAEPSLKKKSKKKKEALDV